MKILIGITNPAAAAVARSSAREFAENAGWPEVPTEELVICVSEIAQNIIDHGGGRGEIALNVAEPSGGIPRVELTASDSGSGINLQRVFADSRPVGRGNGLPALGRLLNHIEFSLSPHPGVRISAWKEPSGRTERKTMRTVVVSRPHPKEQINGDSWTSILQNGKQRFAVADGLGHGPLAHQASRLAVESLASTIDRSPADALICVHDALAGTRGAVMTCVDIDTRSGEMTTSTVGNTRMVWFQEMGVRWNPVATDGILGQAGNRPRRIPPMESRQPPERGLLVMFSDGISSRLQLDGPLMAAQSSSVHTALSLFARFAGNTDDATLLLAVPM